MTEQERRRRGLLAETAETVEKNCLAPGEYTNGSSVYSVDRSGWLWIRGWSANAANKLVVPLLRPLNVAVGDTLRVLIKKVSGTVSSSFFVDGYVGGNKFSNNLIWESGATAQDCSMTATSTNAGQLTLKDNNTTATFTNYAVSIQIFVNGQQKIPEV